MWVAPEPRPAARLILLCAPYASGGASVFRSWPTHLPHVEVIALQLPGREQRVSERPMRRLVDVVRAAVPELMHRLDRPFALFGHSLGGLLAFEIALELRRACAVAPVKLMVSACRAPQSPPPRRTFDLPDRELVATLADPRDPRRSLAGSPELMELMLPSLRADLEIAQTYEYRPRPPLPCRIVGYYGTDDQQVGAAGMAPWAQHTSAGYRQHVMPGDHFFVIGQRRRLLAAVAAELTVQTG